jgi:hypothetical protein
MGVAYARRMGSLQTIFFPHCEIACTLWNILFFNHFGLSWVMPRRIVDLFSCWWTVVSTKSVVVCKMVSSCLLWCLWKEINDRSCKGRKKMFVEFKSFCFNTVYLWTSALVSLLMLSFHDFLILFSPFSQVLLLYTWLCFTILMIYRLLIKKIKKLFDAGSVLQIKREYVEIDIYFVIVECKY